MAAAAAAKQIDTHRNGAEICHGEICSDKTRKLLEEFSIPTGLLPVDEVEEFGFNRSTGFLWLRMKKSNERTFKKLGKTVVYCPEITAFVEKGHMSKVTGIKGKELFVSIGICDLLVGAPSADMVKFTTAVGLSRSHPLSALELEEDGENRSK